MIITEVAIIVTAVGWFVSPNISRLSEVARSWIGSNLKWYTGLPDKLERLAYHLQEISGTLGAASKGFINDPNMMSRLWELKDAIDDAEEIMGAFEYEILNVEAKNRRNRLRQAVGCSFDFAKQMVGSKKSLNRLKKLVERLDVLRQRSQDLRQASQDGARPMARLTTTPLSRKKMLPVYHKEYAQLLSKLAETGDGDTSSSNRGGDAQVIAIIGHGGMGKTELARRAFNDQHEVRAKFDHFIWVCLYAKFTRTEILREIWRSAYGARPVGEMNDTCTEDELVKMVTSKRCLLVLDDVCNDESMGCEFHRKKVWEEVLAPFKQHGERGSRIVMTTRAKICSATLDAGARIVLNGITPKETTKLLKKKAFGSEDTDHVPPQSQLQRVFEDNAGRLHGSPLAVEALVDDNELTNITDTSKWEENLQREHHKSVIYNHLSSYQDLPPHLQRCFAFCSIFPTKWRFEPKKLAKMWMAHGFIEGGASLDGKSTEDVARGYFDDLLKRSLFEEREDTHQSKPCCYYVIHEHIHSMIRHVCPQYYKSIAVAGTRHGAAISIPRTVRHLSVPIGCLGKLKPEYSGGLKMLRTLLVLKDGDDPITSSSTTTTTLSAIGSSVLKKFKGVRVLDLTDTGIKFLPKTVGELKHLRYLGLPDTMRSLPARVTRLLLLQTLGASNTCIAKIRRIGSLSKLQGSVEFHVGGETRKGHSMSELAGMNSLRRTLSIKGLETVASTEQAQEAQLTSKVSLKVLKLEWDPRDLRLAEASAEVLEGLQPHPNLPKLHIRRYPGTTSPTWLASSSALENLTSLYLQNCRNLQALPPLGRLPRLKLLEIKELTSVQRLDHDFCGGGAFPSLEEIVLDDMPRLVGWDDIDMPGTVVFPKLREVKISDCPMLSSLSGLGRCRRTLSLLRLESCDKITDESLPADFTTTGFPCLLKLNIVGCTGLKLEALPRGGAL